jgi:hypothetical protein
MLSVHVSLDLPSDAAITGFTLKNKKQTPWPLVRKRNIPAERPPLLDEI